MAYCSLTIVPSPMCSASPVQQWCLRFFPSPWDPRLRKSSVVPSVCYHKRMIWSLVICFVTLLRSSCNYNLGLLTRSPSRCVYSTTSVLSMWPKIVEVGNCTTGVPDPVVSIDSSSYFPISSVDSVKRASPASKSLPVFGCRQQTR